MGRPVPSLLTGFPECILTELRFLPAFRHLCQQICVFLFFHIIGGIDEIQLMLDDHLVKTQSMRGSPFVKPFESRAEKWEAQLTLIQEIIDVWLKVQAMWQYLEPIFGSEDIMRQMPKEGALFKRSDKMWRENAQTIVRDPHVLVASEVPGLVESYTEQNGLLELVHKGLNEYLEMKRLFFPRFFFLSNDEMLEILSETKDPTRVQPHLGKCFDGIGKLQFEGDINIITGMSSAEGELVSFGNSKVTPSARVEQWLLEVEAQMFASIARVCTEGATAYERMPRHEWVTKWQAQVVLTVTVMMWTRDVDEVLRKTGNAGAAHAQSTDQLDRVPYENAGALLISMAADMGALGINSRPGIIPSLPNPITMAADMDGRLQS